MGTYTPKGSWNTTERDEHELPELVREQCRKLGIVGAETIAALALIEIQTARKNLASAQATLKRCEEEAAAVERKIFDTEFGATVSAVNTLVKQRGEIKY